MRRIHISIFLSTLLCMLILMACANMGTPDGGPYDETPPKVVRTSPKYGERNSSATKVVIEFDEIVKIENAQEKVMVSPPQIEQPEVEAMGRKVTVTLLDSLKPNMTYTIDFADAIVDNNEGNPYGDYAFTFSTGEQMDTMQVSGNVLDASNLEPIKGMLVGLYKVGGNGENDTVKALPDSTFRTVPLERISRTDSRGHFVIKGLAPGKYRVFALDDKNQNFVYDQRSEMVAISERILATSSKPDFRNDTIWHDSIHYDSIVTVPYTHFYPDDIVLRAYLTSAQDRHLLKSERLEPQMFSLYFTAPSDTLPKLQGLNFEADSAFVIDASAKNDTITYWIKDSLIYNIDTLNIKLDYFATDTAGLLALTTDTLYLSPKLTREKIAKEKEKKMENWVKQHKQKIKDAQKAAKRDKGKKSGEGEAATDSVAAVALNEDSIPPMPEEFLDYKTTNTASLDPDQNIDFEFTEPLDSVDMSKLHFSYKVDSVFVPTKFLFRQLPGTVRKYRLYAEWEPDTTYQLEIDTAAFVNIYGKRSEGTKKQIKVKSLDSYSTLFVALQNADSTAIVQLLDGGDKVVKSVKSKDGKADFYFMAPGVYYMRLFNDRNGNGKWDTGDYDEGLQPEEVYYYPNSLTLKAKWELTQDWDITATPLPKQKPEKITKQKPDKERKSMKGKNEERLRQKREGNKKPQNGTTNNMSF